MKLRNAIVIGSALAVFGCATSDPNRRAKTGAAVGAVVGGVVGHQTKGDQTGRVLGAAVGAITGAAVGDYMDKQQQELDKSMEEEQQQKALEIERLNDDTVKLSLSSEVSFDFDSARIKPAFHDTLNKLGDVIKKYDRTIVHVVGFTDSKGSESYNMELSKRRAEAVVAYLVEQSVPASRLRAEGRGESEPRDSNETEAGRQLNRRVEVFVKPVVEGSEQKAYENP